MKVGYGEEEILQAFIEQRQLDSMKTYNKKECKTNWIGRLGEMALSWYFTEKGITHTSIDYVKKGWNEPDFIINGKTIDLKTTRIPKRMYFQANHLIHDIYIGAFIDLDKKEIEFYGFITKESLRHMVISSPMCNKVTSCLGRVDYFIPADSLLPIPFMIGGTG